MDQPTITPGSNGYQSLLPTTDYGTNPWSGVAVSDGAYAVNQQTVGMQNLTNMSQAATQYSNQSAPYPSFPNAAGVGSQSAFSGIPQASPQVDATNMGNSSMNQTPSSNNGAANPWSFQGEANSR